MKVVVLVLVIIAALFAIVSGVWVAIALIRAISTRRSIPAEPSDANEKGGKSGLDVDLKSSD